MARTKHTERKRPVHRPPDMTDAVFSVEQRTRRSCTECDRHFGSVSSLRRHCIIKHGKTAKGVAVDHAQIEKTRQSQRHRASGRRHQKDDDRPAAYASEDVTDTSPASKEDKGRRSSTAPVTSGPRRQPAPAIGRGRRSSAAPVTSGPSHRSASEASEGRRSPAATAAALTAERQQTSPLSAIIRQRPSTSRAVVTAADHWFEPSRSPPFWQHWTRDRRHQQPKSLTSSVTASDYHGRHCPDFAVMCPELCLGTALQSVAPPSQRPTAECQKTSYVNVRSN